MQQQITFLSIGNYEDIQIFKLKFSTTGSHVNWAADKAEEAQVWYVIVNNPFCSTPFYVRLRFMLYTTRFSTQWNIAW